MERTSRRSSWGKCFTSYSSRARSDKMYSRSDFAARNAPRPMAIVPPKSSAMPASKMMCVETSAPCTPETTANAATSPSFAPKTRSRTDLPPGMCAASEWVAPSSRVRRKKPGSLRGIVNATACHGSRRVTTAGPAGILWLVLRVILIFTLITAAAVAQPGQSLRRTVALLDYVAGDYAQAVGPSGEVLSLDELAEQQHFVQDAA